MAAFGSEASLPHLRLLVQSRDGLLTYETPSPQQISLPKKASTNDFEITSASVAAASVPCELSSSDIVLPAVPRSAPLYDPSGRFLCVMPHGHSITLIDTKDATLRLEIPIQDAQNVYFSPLGGFLVTFSQPSTTKAGEGNLRVWSTSTGELITSISQKVFKQDVLQWTADESYVFKQITNEVQVYRSGTVITEAANMIARIQFKGFTQYKVAPSENPAGVLTVAFFSPESGGNPGRVTLFSLNLNTNEVNGPLGSRSIFGASEANLLWNSTSSTLLIYSQSSVDTSGASYYGATSVYYITAQGDDSGKVEQTKEGPVHDVKWSPEGDKFVMSAGNMPAQVTLYDTKAQPIFQFGASHRNTIVWSPHGRFLCVAGFGNLAGEMDFYDILRLKKIGSNTSHCTTAFAWSPDSRYFLTSSLAPRMNVDNHLKIFRYNGDGPVARVDFERAYEVAWMPAQKNVYPNRGPSPGRSAVSQFQRELAQEEAKKVVKPAPYRPPRSTGTVSSLMNRESEKAPVGKVPKSAPATNNAPQTSGAAKFVPSVKSQRVIPGMAPPTGNSKPAAPKAAVSAAPATSQPKPAAKPAPTAAPQSKPSTPAATVVVESAADKEKRAKALQKKLKQIDEIKARISAGQTVEPEQLKKVESEAALRAELRALTV